MPPLESREITVLLSGLLLAACTLRFRHELRRVPSWRLLAVGIVFLIIGGLFTVVEHLFAYEFFNSAEHAAYLLQSIALAVWAVRIQKARA